jgi:hypothetical protein
MVKKVLMAFGFLFVLLAVLFAGVLVWAMKSGAGYQERFFTAVDSGDAGQVMAIFHPALREEVDEPVLAAWITAVNGRLGGFQGLSKTDFNTATRFHGSVRQTQSQATVNFEKGTARSQLVFHDDQIVEFSVESDTLKDWFQGPSSTELYRRRGAEFLGHVLRGEPDAASAMMHPALRDVLPLEKLKQMIANISAAGPLQAIEYHAENMNPGDGHHLTVFYRVACENDETLASVTFQFVGLKGHLVAFNLDDQSR